LVKAFSNDICRADGPKPVSMACGTFSVISSIIILQATSPSDDALEIFFEINEH
jgi:hypothetical protein